jgi:hypothetical protein
MMGPTAEIAAPQGCGAAAADAGKPRVSMAGRHIRPAG